MDKYGLTEQEKKTNLYFYNHALFRNMMFFMDIAWEINMLTGTAVVIQDKTGRSRNSQEFVYQTMYEEYLQQWVSEEDRAVFEQYFEFSRLEQIADDISVDIHMITKEGGKALHRIVLTPARDENRLCRVYLGAKDIQAEENRQLTEYRNQQQFREVILSNSYAYCTFDVSGDGIIYKDHITGKGRRFVRKITGRDLPIRFEELVERWKAIYQPIFLREEDIFTIAFLKKAYARGDRIIEEELKQKVVGDDGKAYGRIIIVLTENPDDRHIYATIVWYDIDGSRKNIIDANLDLKESNERLRQTINQEEQFRLATLANAILVYNINLTKNLIEEEFYEILEEKRYPMLAMVGLEAPCNFDIFCERWCEAKVVEDSRETFLQHYNRNYLLAAFERGERRVEMEFDMAIGRGIVLTTRSTAVLYQNQQTGDVIAMMNTQDITEQRKEERRQRETLREALAAANRANIARTDFLARMSHDIRTPMNAIIGMTAIAETHLDDAERIADCLQKISVSSRHLLSIIDEVLDMSNFESGRIVLQSEEMNLFDLIDNMKIVCKVQMEHHHHTFYTEYSGVEHGRVIGDIRRIQKCLRNLLDNAAKYTPDDGTIRLSVTERPTSRKKIGCYEFVVEDNGFGISEEFIPHMFDLFSRADDMRIEKISGTGLGLPIVKSIVQMMNGDIRVESAPEQGTKCTVVLFLQRCGEEEETVHTAGAESSLHAFSRGDYSGLRVLLVEDNALNAEIVEEILKMVGFEIDWAENGKVALEKMECCEEGFYDLIFMDIQMPVMNGYEATERIRSLDREYCKRIPILALSANAFAEDIQKSKMSGMNEHIAKPLDFGKLKSALDRWL